MEGGANSSRTSCMMGFEGNNIMMPLMNSVVEANNKLFLPLPLSGNSCGQKTSSLMSEEDYGNRMESNNSCMRAKIMAHPLFPRLLAAYVNCQKVGAPPEVVARLEDAYANLEAATGGRPRSDCIGRDPGLDQFMEAYCEMLTKYEQELSKPFKEAMLFFSRIECQLKALTISSSDSGGDILNLAFYLLLNSLKTFYLQPKPFYLMDWMRTANKVHSYHRERSFSCATFNGKEKTKRILRVLTIYTNGTYLFGGWSGNRWLDRYLCI